MRRYGTDLVLDTKRHFIPVSLTYRLHYAIVVHSAIQSTLVCLPLPPYFLTPVHFAACGILRSMMKYVCHAKLGFNYEHPLYRLK